MALSAALPALAGGALSKGPKLTVSQSASAAANVAFNPSIQITTGAGSGVSSSNRGDASGSPSALASSDDPFGSNPFGGLPAPVSDFGDFPADGVTPSAGLFGDFPIGIALAGVAAIGLFFLVSQGKI